MSSPSSKLGPVGPAATARLRLQRRQDTAEPGRAESQPPAHLLELFTVKISLSTLLVGMEVGTVFEGGPPADLATASHDLAILGDKMTTRLVGMA